MRLVSLLLTIAPAAGMMLFVGEMGLISLLPALLMETVCLFGLKKTGNAANMTALCLTMEGAVLLTAAGSMYGRGGAPEELGWAALLMAAAFYAAAYLTLCGFILKKP